MEKITEQEYRCAYKEVITILNVIDSRFKKMIPKEKIDFYIENLDESHKFEYDYSKNVNEQNILYPTKCIIANLFKNYIATENDRYEIIKREEEELRKIEEEKRKLYSVNDIFDKKIESQNIESLNNSDKIVNSNNQNGLIIVSDKKDIFKIVKEKIISFINKFKNKI